MNIRSKRLLTAALALGGVLGIGATTAIAGTTTSTTTTYTLNVTGPSLGLTVSQGNSTLTLPAGGTISDTVTLQNTGTTSGTIGASLGTPPTGIVYGQLPFTAPGELAVMVNDNQGSQPGWAASYPSSELAPGESQLGTLSANTTAKVGVEFQVSANTASGSYNVPINWSIN
jgi:hypothetical protein